MPSHPLSDGRVKSSGSWLIEQCGLKENAFGQAGVYEHQGFGVSQLVGVAEEQRLPLLAENITETVSQRFGIQIEP